MAENGNSFHSLLIYRCLEEDKASAMDCTFSIALSFNPRASFSGLLVTHAATMLNPLLLFLSSPVCFRRKGFPVTKECLCDEALMLPVVFSEILSCIVVILDR